MERVIKIIVAGGRDFDDYDMMKNFMDGLEGIYGPDAQIQVVSGMAKGADSVGEDWAFNSGWYVHRFPAKWDELGKIGS